MAKPRGYHHAAKCCLLSGVVLSLGPEPDLQDWPGLGLHDSRDLLSCNCPGEFREQTGRPRRAHSLALGVSIGSEESRVQSLCPGERGPPSGKPTGGRCLGYSPTGVSSGRLNRAMFPLVLPTPLSKKCGAKLAWARKRTGRRTDTGKDSFTPAWSHICPVCPGWQSPPQPQHTDRLGWELRRGSLHHHLPQAQAWLGLVRGKHHLGHLESRQRPISTHQWTDWEPRAQSVAVPWPRSHRDLGHPPLPQQPSGQPPTLPPRF